MQPEEGLVNFDDNHNIFWRRLMCIHGANQRIQLWLNREQHRKPVFIAIALARFTLQTSGKATWKNLI